MSQTSYQRLTITVPDSMASQIEQVCRDEGRNRSELFREAFRVYLTHSQDRLATESEKNRLLEQWAHTVETEPGFEDVRAVSDAADGVASEAV
jgi:metal-responsive CopG/Arc/MetJ family transcriptional regulator